jgi:hypothetical protein
MTIKEIVSRDGRRKVVIFRRDDGSYGFESLQFSDVPEELCWIPSGKFSACHVADETTAETEARGRVEWLREET